MNVVAKWPGSVHDSRVLRQSQLFADMESGDKPVDGFILGDSGYMLRNWLLTPIPNPSTKKERTYNFYHSSTRSTVERCIGVAKRRWHCLRRLRVNPQKACKIIIVCLMLHNRARTLRLEELPGWADATDIEVPVINYEDLPSVAAAADERVRGNEGKLVRDRVIRDYC